MKYAWIARHKLAWPITLTCEVLGVSPSGYFEHYRRKDIDKPSRPGANKRISDEALLVHIKAIHAEVKQEYGWPRIWKELVARGIRVGKERVRKLMQRHGIKARGKRKFVVTTDSKHDLPIAPNLLQRNFSPEAPNLVWTSDITYIATDEGWLYLTAVLDLFSRQVVGWSMRDHMQAKAVTDALRMAWFRRRPEAGLIFHSDRGSQGGFNRSSQHLNHGGVYGTTRRVDAEVDGARSDAFARCAVASARSGAKVLGADCDRDYERESCRSGRRVAGRRRSLVPSSWRYAIVYVETCVGKIFVVRGSRRNWTAASSRRWCARDRSAHWSKPFYGLTRADTQRCNPGRQARVPGIGCAMEGRASCQKAETGQTCD